MLRSLSVSVLVCLPSLAAGAPFDGDPTNYRDQAAMLTAGDTLQLAPGRYTDCLTISGMHGTAASPIVIEGAAPFGGGVVFDGTACTGLRTATIFIEDSSYVVIRDLEIDLAGAAANGIRAGYGTTPVHNITIEGLYIHDNDVNNQHSGIGSFATAWDWMIRGNRIERTGLGMYLGDSDGTAPFIRATIEHNLILNPRGYGAQIKHQIPRVMVAGMPTTDSVTMVRRNVIIKEQNAGTGGDARPNLLIGDLPSSGVGADDRYEVYGNFFYENASDVEPLFQGEGNVTIHDNIFVNTFAGNAIVVRPHNGVVRDIGIFHNTFLVAGSAIGISGGDGVTQQVIANAIYGDGAPLISGANDGDNRIGMFADAAAVFVASDPTLGTLDLFPAAMMPLQALAPTSLGRFADRTDVGFDFNGAPRDNTWRGAYAASGSNPGWMLAAEARPPLVAMPPRDGGVVNPPRDAGIGAVDAGAVDDGGTSDAGTREAGVVDINPAPTTDDEGCACSARRRQNTPSLLFFVVLLAWICRAGHSPSKIVPLK